MSEIILYSGEMFTDSNETYMNEASDYQSITSLKDVKSLKVTNGIWIVYSKPNYNGNIAVYKAGAYGSALKIKTIGSFRKLSGLLENPDITVFELSNYQGSHKEFKDPEHLAVPSPIESHQVVNGVWTLYDEAGYKGNSIVSIREDQVPNETNAGLSGPVKSLQAYLAYEPEKRG